MLAEKKQHLWKELLSEATHQELIWMNGYLSGLLYHRSDTIAGTGNTPASNNPAQPAPAKITIAYGTETGNAKNLSARLAAYARSQGVITRLVSLEQYKPADLAKETRLFVVISTQGDGEPPAGARKFYDYIHTGSLTLPQLQYAVLALGDSSYPQFCKTGTDVDQQLERAGASRFAPTLTCDTDYDQAAISWFQQALQYTGSEAAPAPLPHVPLAAVATGHKQYYKGVVQSIVNLNDTGSAKETYHIEIATDAAFTPGDAIGIHPPNPDSLVAKVLALAGVADSRELMYKGETQTLGALLRHRLNITYLPVRVINKYAAIVGQAVPDTAMGLLDLLSIYPVSTAAQFLEVVQVLEPNAPRLYSISSAPAAHPGEIHLTVCRNTFEINDTRQFGLCSDYLAAFTEGQELEFYVHANHRFRLPHSTGDVIMIGPGTGIAPFRSFLWERDANGASGRNWLFFGEQHFVSDFLYQTELQAWHETGLLTQVNVAFSRDQQQKIYVQHKIKEHGASFYAWLESGASVYICGSKHPMSTDVEAAITEVIATYGNHTTEQALHYLDNLKAQARYHTDVY